MTTPTSKDGSEIQLRSEPFQEIIGQVPHAVVRWGISVISAALALVLVGSWFIKYPDVIAAPIALRSAIPALSVVARSNGKLVLLAKEGDSVKEGAYIGVLENPAKLSDVLEAKRQVDNFRRVLSQPLKWVEVEFPLSPELGELQTRYLEFLQSFLNHRSFLDAQYYKKKIKSASDRIDQHKELSGKLEAQRALLEKEVEFAENSLKANKDLFNKKIISKSDLVAAENSFLEKKHALVEEEKRLIENEIEVGDLSDSIIGLEQQEREENRKGELSVGESLERLQSELSSWEQKYILKAPVDGYVSMYKFWSDSQFIKEGEEVMAVVPSSERIIGKLTLGEVGAGKVKAGQRVRIHLRSYPAKEFGTIDGEVLSISRIPRDDTYSVDVKLPIALVTSYGKSIKFNDGMQGDAYVITNDMRLLERIFFYFRYLVSSSAG